MVRGKKALASEIIFLMVVLFFLAISLVTVIFVNDKIADVIRDNEKLNSTAPADDIINALDTINEDTVNNSFAFIAGALILSIVLTAFLARIHPVWFFVFMLVAAICIIVAAPLSNIYEEVLANPAIADSVASEQTTINFFMENLVTIMIVTTVLGVVVAMSKEESVISLGGSDI